ncbi:putative pumilio homolog 7, chloroplastic isoform X2 [Primulina eburnea]
MQESDPSYAGVHIFTMGGNNTSAPVPAGQRPPTNRLPPLPPVCFSLGLKGKVFWQAMDPYGCQLLHQKLQARKPEDIQMIFSEVKDQICLLMFDRLGSYVIQKLFEVCDEEQRTQLVSSVTSDIPFLKVVCLNSQGSESMKKFLECLTTPKQISDMMSVFQQLTLPLVNHHIGYVVIAHCFDVFPIPAEETKPILDVITDNFLEIATNPSGICLLRQILVSEVFLLESLPTILSEIIVNVYQLSQDPIGFEVVEHVIHLGTQDVIRDIVAKLRRDFAALSMDKYARNVVIELMVKCQEKYAHQIMDDLIINPYLWRSHLEPFVNFVPRCVEEYAMVTLSDALNSLDVRDSDHQQSHHNGKNVLPRKRRRDRV